MASTGSSEIDLKTFHAVRDFLQTNEVATEPSKPGAFKLFSFPPVPRNSCDLVFEGIYLGEASIAVKQNQLKSMGVTHVINVSQGKKYCQTNTDAEYYKEAGIQYHGISAMDIMTFKILPHLRPAAEFIHKALEEKGIVYVHCQQGVSRSSTVVLAYLMLYKGMSLMTAAQTVRAKREIFPNEGFLKQLCMLEKEIQAGSTS